MDVFFIIRNLFLFSLAVIFFLIICLCYFLFTKTAQLDKQVSSLRDIIQQMIQEIRTQQMIQSRGPLPNYTPVAEGGHKEIINIRPFSAAAAEADDEDDEAEDDEDEAEDDEDEDETEIDEAGDEAEAEFIDEEVQDIGDILSVHEDEAEAEAEEAAQVDLDDFDAPEEPEIKHIEISAPAEEETEPTTTVVVSKLPALPTTDTPQDQKPSFRHLNIQQLKQIVISKGLATNTSKMKKDDLLNLLDPATTLD